MGVGYHIGFGVCWKIMKLVGRERRDKKILLPIIVS